MKKLKDLLGGIELEPPSSFLCQCGAEVSTWRERCQECQAMQRKADRALLLGYAYASLPAMPGAFWDQLDGRVNPTVIAALRAWRGGDAGLLITGPSGCGKTTACVAKMRLILDTARDKDVPREKFKFAARMRFVVAADLAIARRQWPLGGGEAPAVEEAMRASLLVLDEIGYESTADTAVPETIDARYRRGLPTVVTTGLRFNEVEKRYGEATTRKFLGRGKVVDAWK